jgi:hypothetical protein
MSSSIIRNEFAGSVYGVPGRFMNVIQLDTGRIANQKWVSELRLVGKDYRNKPEYMRVEIRFDDECQNGHESFSITAEIVCGGQIESCVCLHDDIRQHFPELSGLIEWHLVSTDGPMYCIENTLYHASERDHWGLLKGEPSKNAAHYKTCIRFGDSPISHIIKKETKEFIQAKLSSGERFAINEVQHDNKPGEYAYSPKYEFLGMDLKWFQCPFDTKEEAEEWAKALRDCEIAWSEKCTVFGEGKKRDLDAARRSACWLDATDEELYSPNLEEKLRERLPLLASRFKDTMKEVGFIYPE